MFPRISIIVPVYNTENYLRECLNSIAGQTYKNIEVIIVDDGSTDSSGNICDYYAERDARFRVIHTKNNGLISARKIGLSHASGDYIGFVDSDDWIQDVMYQSLVERLKDTETDMICFATNVVSSDKDRLCLNTIKEGTYIDENLLLLYPIMMFNETENSPGIFQSVWTKLFKKSLLELCLPSIQNEITYGEDAAIVYSCCLMAKKILVINDAYYYYRENPTSICGKKDIGIFEKIDLFYKYMEQVFNKYPKSWGLERQLRLYILYFIKIGLDRNFNIQCKNRYQISYKQLLNCNKIILYGAGKVGISYYEQLTEQGIWDIVLWIDKRYVGEYRNGHAISSINLLKETEYDKIVIAVQDESVVIDIKEQLIALGIESKKIVWLQPIINPLQWEIYMKMVAD